MQTKRKWNTLALLSVLMYAAMGVLMSFLLSSSIAWEERWPLALMSAFGGVAVGVALIGAIHFTTIRQSNNVLACRLSRWQARIATGGVIAGMCSLLGGLVLFSVGARAEHPSAVALVVIPCIFWGTIASVVFHLYCIVMLWSQCHVRKGALVINNGRVYFPGDVVALYPWFENNVSILEEYLAFNENKVAVTCKDGVYTVGVSVALAFDFPTMRASNVRAFDTYAFVKKAQQWLIAVVKCRAHDRTLGELLTKPHDAASTTIDNIPIAWDGKGTFSFAQ